MTDYDVDVDVDVDVVDVDMNMTIENLEFTHSLSVFCTPVVHLMQEHRTITRRRRGVWIRHPPRFIVDVNCRPLYWLHCAASSP